MVFDSERHHRGSIRLKGYDYTQAGVYFITMVTHARDHLLGMIKDGEMMMSTAGEIVAEELARSPEIRKEIELVVSVVMPNHVHAIIQIRPDVGAHVGAHGLAPVPIYRSARSLGSMVAGFKAATTKRINEMRGTPGMPVWQRNYYDRIIRNDKELERIYTYIEENPHRWADDALHIPM